MTILNAIQTGIKELQAAEVPDPKEDTLLLLSHVMNIKRLLLYFNGEKLLSTQQEQLYKSLLLSRKSRLPLQYILHQQYFYGLKLFVDENVLIPRPETETLCEIALQFLKSFENPSVLDLCTGSGAIALTIKNEMPTAIVSATDISFDALAIAKKNSQFNKLDVSFYQSDIFSNLKDNKYNLIVSNPPYIESEHCKVLQKEVLFEPKLALDGGDDGLYFYRKIIKEAPTYLHTCGIILFEVGDKQACSVKELFASIPNYQNIQIHKDLYGKNRIVSAKIIH